MYKKVIVPLDGSAFAEQALATATQIAKASGAEIELLTVHFPTLFPHERGTHAEELLRQEEHAYLARIGNAFRTETDLTVRAAVRDGSPADAICEFADWFEDALIVITTHGRTGFHRSWIGSVADAVMRNSQHAVMMVRPTEAPGPWTPAAPVSYRLMMVPLDGSTFAEAALPHATRVAELLGARLELLRVVELPHPFVVPFTTPADVSVSLITPETIDALVQSATTYVAETAMRERTMHASLTIGTAVTVSEAPARAILDAANERGADLIAMATHGRGVSRLVMASVTDKVLRGTTAAMLLVRAATD